MIAERKGVEIDYCPQCRGVWLDRGELEKLIDRSAASAPPPPSYRDDRYEERRPRKKRAESFLGELFDF